MKKILKFQTPIPTFKKKKLMVENIYIFFKVKGQISGHSTILAYEDSFNKKFQPTLNKSKLGN